MSKHYTNAKRQSSKQDDTKIYKPRNGKGKSSKSTVTYSEKIPTNNPAWYANNAELMRDAASLPFSTAVGTTFSTNNPALSDAGLSTEYTVPGVQSIELLPSVGHSGVANDPINTASFRVYTFIRHQNSGHTNYDAPDLMLYILAMSQVYSYINFLQRAYGVALLYAQKNRYMPNTLLNSMYLDVEDIQSNLAEFRYGINMLINKAASLAVPADMPIFSQFSHVFQNIYIEGESIKDQMYIFNPAGFWKFTLDNNSAGMLEVARWNNIIHSVSEAIEFGNDMLSRLIMSEDMNIMSGDILKAYGPDKLIKLAVIDSGYTIIPLQDKVVLNQIKNATIFNDTNYATFKVAQDPSRGWLVHKPSMAVDYGTTDNYSSRALAFILRSYGADKVLTVNSAQPTPEEVMEYTRFMGYGSNYNRKPDPEIVSTMYIRAGSLVPVVLKQFYLDTTTGMPKSYILSSVVPVDVSIEGDVVNCLRNLANARSFHYTPMVQYIPYRPGSEAPAFNITDGWNSFDFDNYTVLHTDTLARIHEAAMLSLLNVTSYVKV